MKYSLIYFLALVISLTATATDASSGTKPGQRKQVKTLTTKLTALQTQLRLAERRNRALQRSLTDLTGKAQARIDSMTSLKAVVVTTKTTVATLENTIATLTASLAEIQAQNQALQTALAGQLEKTQQQVARLEYERRVLTDRAVLRVYKLAPSEVRARLLARLNKTKSGFSFDNDASVPGAIRVVRKFDNREEVHGLFAKASDLMLELTLIIQPHQHDQQQTLLLTQTKLSQKKRSGKTFERVVDEAAINRYRDESLALLEGDLRAMSDK